MKLLEEYLKYINEEPFYVPPTFNDVKTDIKQSTLNPKFLLFSAPGATGKSSLARHIAYQYNGIYWNLAKVKIGTNSFIGSILNAVGATKYSEFINDLNAGNVLLVIDAFDEAEIVSGRRMLNSFLSEISESMTNHQMPTVILLARTETAQYIASFCTENSISLMHYEIGFFNEDSSKDFIVKSVVGKNPPTKPDFECASFYYEFIKNNITENERISFLGYAPVLEAISTHIRSYPNRQKLLSELAIQKDCVSVIMNIMDDLLLREQTEKVIPAFKKKSMENHPEFTDWDKVYSVEEQLVRIIYYVLFGDTVYSNYELDFLPPQLVDDYQVMLETFLQQHPFIRKGIETLDSGKSADLKGGISFNDITFRYGYRKPVISNLSVNIPAGAKVAIVGESGSGKTTLMKLLMAFYQPESGEIIVGKRKLTEFSPKEIRERIAYVSQNVFFFSDTVKENLVMGNKSITDEEIEEACKKAMADDFIKDLPMEYETVLSENASNLSSGQRQRLSIARALLRKPDIMILDEATSNLDTVTEQSIKNMIFGATKGLTTFIIAHRLSTIKNCDIILVMENGEIVESGTHDTLINANGRYTEYWKSNN